MPGKVHASNSEEMMMSRNSFEHSVPMREQRAPMFMFVASFMAVGLMAVAVMAFGGVA